MATERKMVVVPSGEQGSVLRLRIEGTIQRDPQDGLVDPFPDALGPAGYGGKVLLDLSRVDFMDTSGYSWLLRQQKNFASAGGKLALHSIPSLIMRIFSTVRADLVFRIAANEAAALQLVQETAA